MGLEWILATSPRSAALLEQLRLLCGTEEEFDAVLADLFREVTTDTIHGLQEFGDVLLMVLEDDAEQSPLVRMCAGYLRRWREANA